MVNNFDITFEETVDPRGLNCGEDRYNDYGCSRVAVQQDYEIPPKLMPASRIAQKSPQKWPKAVFTAKWRSLRGLQVGFFQITP